MKKIEKILAFGLMAGIAVGGAFAAKKTKTIKIGHQEWGSEHTAEN